MEINDLVFDVVQVQVSAIYVQAFSDRKHMWKRKSSVQHGRTVRSQFHSCSIFSTFGFPQITLFLFKNIYILATPFPHKELHALAFLFLFSLFHKNTQLWSLFDFMLQPILASLYMFGVTPSTNYHIMHHAIISSYDKKYKKPIILYASNHNIKLY